LIGVCASLIAVGGGDMLPVAATESTTDRDSAINVVQDDTSTAAVQLDFPASVSENTTTTLVTVTNQLGDPATLTFKLSGQAVEADVDFESSAAVTTRDNGDTADISLTNMESVVVEVTIADGAASRVDTIDVTVTGSTDSDGVSLTLGKRTGPTVDP
jgi:hypothetical protein